MDWFSRTRSKTIFSKTNRKCTIPCAWVKNWRDVVSGSKKRPLAAQTRPVPFTPRRPLRRGKIGDGSTLFRKFSRSVEWNIYTTSKWCVPDANWIINRLFIDYRRYSRKSTSSKVRRNHFPLSLVNSLRRCTRSSKRYSTKPKPKMSCHARHYPDPFSRRSTSTSPFVRGQLLAVSTENRLLWSSKGTSSKETLEINQSINRCSIFRYLTGNEQHPLIIYGAEGSGKTCLLARAAQQCHSWQQPDPECTLEMGVVLRFIRLTPESSSVLTILHSITQQVSLLTTGRLPRNPHVRK